jgi:hypothetical protein
MTAGKNKMKPIVFIEGIAEGLKEGKIDTEFIKQLISTKRSVGPKIPGQMIMQKQVTHQIGRKLLRVFYREDNDAIRVISAKWEKIQLEQHAPFKPRYDK